MEKRAGREDRDEEKEKIEKINKYRFLERSKASIFFIRKRTYSLFKLNRSKSSPPHSISQMKLKLRERK